MTRPETVPTVDISCPSVVSRAALDRACRDHGFFLLSGHGLDDLIARMWEQTHRLFDSSDLERDALRRDAENPLGYYDRELTKRKRDHKQVFDFIDPSVAARDALNQWPAAMEGFKDTMAEFFAAFSDLAMQTLSLIHDTLELSPAGRALVDADASASAVRLNHYPVGDPVPSSERDGLVELGPTALGHHTDPGVLTLLLQDETGGLQAESRANGWIDVPPQPGTVVVNLADAMQVWTNDRYCAAVHRVLPMTAQRRFSIPYFLNPTSGCVVAPVAELVRNDDALYRPFEWSQFMQARTADNFADIGQADAQISDYRVTV